MAMFQKCVPCSQKADETITFRLTFHIIIEHTSAILIVSGHNRFSLQILIKIVNFSIFGEQHFEIPC